MAAGRSTTSSSPSPEQVTLNLATLEREQVRGVPKPKPKPFSIGMPVDHEKPEGEQRSIIFEDPAEIDAAILMRMEETPGRFFAAALEADDYNFMMIQFETRGALPGWKLQAILQGYQDYYGMDSQGNVRGSRR